MKTTKNPSGPPDCGGNHGATTGPVLLRQQGGVKPILSLLKQAKAISAWLASVDRQDPDLCVVLTERLSEEERQALAQVSHLVIQHDENLAKRLADLERENRELRALSLTDELTGLYNYRFFARHLEVEMARTRRTGQSCCLAMIDLDDFKVLNDTLGHDQGNRYLIKAAQVMMARLRPTDIMCRYGGDEFAVIMPATGPSDALRIAKRLKKSVNALPSLGDKPLSASIGLAEYDPESGGDMSAFVNMADKALYRAKKEGKNKVCYEAGHLREKKAGAVTVDERTALLLKGTATQKRPGAT